MSTFDDLLSAVSELNNPATGVTAAWKSRLQGIESQLPDVKTKVASLSVLDDAFNSELQPFIKNAARDTIALTGLIMLIEGYLTMTNGLYDSLLNLKYSKASDKTSVTSITDAHRYVHEMVRKAKESLGAASSPLEITSTSLDFIGIIGGPNPPTQEIHIQNIGSDTLTWHAEVTNGGSWLIVTPTEGELDPGYSASASTESEFGPGNSASVTVAALLLQGLTPQSIPFSGTVSICERDDDGVEVAGSRQFIYVNFNVGTITSSPTSLPFNCAANGIAPGPQTVNITAIGTGGNTLHWTAAPTVRWLTATPAQGSVGSSSPAQASIGVNPQGLDIGTYTGAIVLTPADGNYKPIGTPQIIEVTLTVQQLCSLQPPQSPYLTFSAEAGTNQKPPTQQFTIGTAGECTDQITLTASNTDPNNKWLQVIPHQQTISGGGGSATFAVTVTPASLPPGSYTDQISISAIDGGGTLLTGSPQYVEVSFTIIAAPALLVSPSSGLVFKDSTGMLAQLITIDNVGGEPLNWTATLDKNAPSFVQLAPDSGSGPILGGRSNSISGGPIPGGGSNSIYVCVNATGVPDNETFGTSVNITATDATNPYHSVAGSPTSVPVSINIARGSLFLCVMKQFYPPDPHTGKDTLLVRQTEKLFKRGHLTLSDRQLEHLTKSWDKVVAFVADPSTNTNKAIASATCLSTTPLTDLFTMHDLLEELYDRIESNVTRSDEDVFGLE